MNNKYRSDIGRRMTWVNIVNKYPNCWVGLSDWKYDSKNLLIGTIESICSTEKQRVEEMKKFIANNKKINWIYTTETKGVTSLWQM